MRDRSTATDFHSPYIPASILTGRRLELIFVEEQEERLMGGRPGGQLDGWVQ